MTADVRFERVGELDETNGSLLEQQIFQELGWTTEGSTESLVEIQIPRDHAQRLADPEVPSRARWARCASNLAFMGLMSGVVNVGPGCPASEVMADKGSLAAQLGEDASNQFLRVSTFNTYENKNGDRKVTNAINAQHSHIVGLQEVNGNSLEAIKAGTDFKEELSGYAHDGKGDFYGLAVLTNLPVISKNTYSLESSPEYERRVVLVATLDNEGEELVVAVTHLINKEPGPFGSDRSEERLRQVRELVGVLIDAYTAGKPIILMGDWNSGKMTEVREYIEYFFNDSAEQLGLEGLVTFPFDGTEKDTIYTSKPSGLKPLELSIWGGDASDHCGVTTTFVRRV